MRTRLIHVALCLGTLAAWGCQRTTSPPDTGPAPAPERFCGLPLQQAQNITPLRSGEQPRFRVDGLPASLILDNRASDQDVRCVVELVGPAARPENLFFRYGRSAWEGVRVEAAADGVRLEYPVRARAYALISVEPPLSPPADPGRHRASEIEIEVSQGAVVRTHEPGLRVRSLGPATRVQLRNTKNTPADIELTVENVSPRLCQPRHSGLEAAVIESPRPTEVAIRGRIPAQQQARVEFQPLPIEPPFVFALAGDSRERPDIFRKILARVPPESAPLFMIFTGDMTHNSLPGELAAFDELLRSLPFPVYTIKGNHDTRAQGDAHYRMRFGPERYTFSVGPLFFAILDSNQWDERGYALGDEPLGWLEQRLAEAKSPWKMIALHVPPHPLHGPPLAGPNSSNMRPADAERLRHIASAAGAAYVLTGHVHLYARAEEEGVVYLSDGGGGAPLYGYQPAPGFTFDTRKGLVLLHLDEKGIREERITLDPAEAPPR